jgi:iron complex transport system ATP-binding protein
MKVTSKSPVVEIENVNFKRQGAAFLDNVSWTIRQGEHWVVLGQNGSGKTTLLKILTGYEWPSSGKVSVLGNVYGQCPLPEIRKRIGWVSSSFLELYEPHFHSPAIDVVISGKYASIGLLFQSPTEEDYRKAHDLLDQFNIVYLAERPLGSLSQGEKIRVLLARAWMAETDLLVLDEPCSGLDLYAREKLLSTIQQMGQSNHAPTMIYVTHHPEEIMPVFNHALLMSGGKSVAQGEKQNVLTDAFLSEAFSLPVHVRWEGNRPWVSIHQE